MRRMKRRAVVWSILLSMFFNTTAWGMDLQSEGSSDGAVLFEENQKEETEVLESTDDIKLERESVSVDKSGVLDKDFETASEESEQQSSEVGNTSADTKEDAEEEKQESSVEAGEVTGD